MRRDFQHLGRLFQHLMSERKLISRHLEEGCPIYPN